MTARRRTALCADCGAVVHRASTRCASCAPVHVAHTRRAPNSAANGNETPHSFARRIGISGTSDQLITWTSLLPHAVNSYWMKRAAQAMTDVDLERGVA